MERDDASKAHGACNGTYNGTAHEWCQTGSRSVKQANVCLRAASPARAGWVGQSLLRRSGPKVCTKSSKKEHSSGLENPVSHTGPKWRARTHEDTHTREHMHTQARTNLGGCYIPAPTVSIACTWRW